MKTIEYQATITFGNILSSIAMLASLVGVYLAHDRRILVLETQLPVLTIAVTKVSASQESTVRTLDKLVILNEERARVGYGGGGSKP